jgi:AraC-like DNA-binding protein
MAYDAAGLVERATRILSASPAKNLMAIAEDLGVHRQTLSKAIQSQTKLSPAEWRDRHLMDALCQTLARRPEWSLKEISNSLGFSGPSVLDRFVRRVKGTTPTDLRNCLARELDSTSVR